MQDRKVKKKKKRSLRRFSKKIGWPALARVSFFLRHQNDRWLRHGDYSTPILPTAALRLLGRVTKNRTEKQFVCASQRNKQSHGGALSRNNLLAVRCRETNNPMAVGYHETNNPIAVGCSETNNPMAVRYRETNNPVAVHYRENHSV